MNEAGRKLSPTQSASFPLRVGFLIDRWQEDRGGAERALFRLARHLASRGHSVRAFALRASEAGPAEGSNGRSDELPCELLPAPVGFSRGARERRLSLALVEAAERAGCDVTIGVRHLARVDVLWAHGGAHAGSLAARDSARAGRELGARAPRLWSRHRVFLELERAALEGGARRVVCVSPLSRAEFETQYPHARARLVTIENGVDLERFHPRQRERGGRELRRALELDARTPMIACAARDPRLKGVETLLAALARLETRPWSFVLAGPRDRAAWERRALAAGLARERVRVVSELDTSALCAASDLAVLPTWRDTCGLFVLEALASGTPVITTRHAGAASHLVDIECGSVLADAGDASLLARAIDEHLTRFERAPVDRERVRASVANCGEARWLTELESLIVDVAAEKRA